MSEPFGQTLLGGAGNDSLHGDTDWDVLRGYDGDDLLQPFGRGGEAHGGDGNDTLEAGGAHQDQLFGDAGDDLFRISEGSANMFGGVGDDTMEASGGTGLFAGGEGLDTAVFAGLMSEWTLAADGQSIRSETRRASFGLTGVEVLRFDDGALLMAEARPGVTRAGDSSAREPAGGTERDDLFVMGDGDDVIYGGGGDDRVFAGGGNDEIQLMASMGGSHVVEAGPGNDIIFAAGWDTRLFGGDGDDRFYSGYGFNAIDGGAGVDTVRYSTPREDYRVEISGNGEAVVALLPTNVAPHDRSRDTLTGVEFIRFSDGTVIELVRRPVTDPERLAGVEGVALSVAPATLLDGDVSSGGPLTLVGVGEAEHGTVAMSGGQVVFTPEAGFHGQAAFVYRVSDGFGLSSQRVTIDFASTNRAPSAHDDALTTAADGTATANLLADNGTGRDFDADGDALRISGVEGAGSATGGVVRLASGALVRFAADGSVTYDPDGAFDGLASGAVAVDHFDYALADPEGAFDIGHVTVNVTGTTPAQTPAPAPAPTPAPALSLFGGKGAQRMLGGDGDDALRGGAGRDVILGGDGDDRLTGDGGRDRMTGGAGDDALHGGRGGDRMIGGLGDDVLRGGAGRDVLRFSAGDGDDRVFGFDPDADRAVFGRGVHGMEALEIVDADGGAIVRHADGEVFFAGLRASDFDAGNLFA